MNILVVCHYGLYQDLTSSFVHGQTRAYAQLGHRVRVIIPIGYGKTGPEDKRFTPGILRRQADGVELYYVRYATLSKYGKRWFNHAAACAAMKKALAAVSRDFAPDVIHAHTLGFDTELGAWLKKRLGVPLVVTSHGSDASIPYEQGDLDFLRRSCDLADAVVAVSAPLAAKVQSCGTKTPVHVITNGFHLQNVPPSNQKQPVSLIQVGNLQEQKRFHITLEAFAKLHRDHPESRLTIVGAGAQRQALEQQCAALGVADAVTFTGRIPNARVLEHMARTQFFVMPSVREGFGIVYLEAMACGCVTIGTQGEGIADVIRHGENGFLVPPDDPDAIEAVLRACLEHPAETHEIARCGRETAAGLTWERNASQYCILIKELIT